MKYICTGGMPSDYRIFADTKTHKEVAEEVGKPVVSAGFIKFDPDGHPIAYGNSISLGVDAHPGRDSLMLRVIWGRGR